MASEREYLEKMSTNRLDALLFQELIGREQMRLASILITCEILAQREPHRGTAKCKRQEKSMPVLEKN